MGGSRRTRSTSAPTRCWPRTPATDPEAVGCSREALLERARRALRFSLASHVSGDHECTDGTRWGHTWISALGIERMMHGVEAIAAELTAADHEALERVLTSEADWLLELPTQGTRWASEGGNKPESNLWNGALCTRAARLAPDHPHAGAWREKAHENLLNSISVPADALDETFVAGKPLSEWHAGPNFFASYALDHHGYLNVGYMVICMSNMAMLHYSRCRGNQPPPETLYHHGADLWRVLRRFIFSDGRLARVGGDSRQRYCYCQDYLLPSLFFCADYFGDEAAGALEAGNLELIRREQARNGDGSFLGERLATIRETNPLLLHPPGGGQGGRALDERVLAAPGGDGAAAGGGRGRDAGAAHGLERSGRGRRLGGARARRPPAPLEPPPGLVVLARLRGSPGPLPAAGPQRPRGMVREPRRRRASGGRAGPPNGPQALAAGLHGGLRHGGDDGRQHEGGL